MHANRNHLQMRERDLGKVRKTAISELKYSQFGHVYKGQIRTQEPHIEFIVYDSIKPTKQLIRLDKVELKKAFWNEKGITFKQLSR
jgi:hypothetical protein